MNRKLIKIGIVFLFLILSGVANGGAVECPPGFNWVRMSGVGCVQEDTLSIAHAKYSYTSTSICLEGYKGCYEPVDYSFFDKSKCDPFCPVSVLVACIDPDDTCPEQKPKLSCWDDCQEKFNQKQPPYLRLFNAKGEYPFCSCICIDERNGEEVPCWGANWDCDKYCSDTYEHETWDQASNWPDCGCICENGFGRGEDLKCLECEKICNESDPHSHYDAANSKPGTCECTCDAPHVWDGKMCIQCPSNSKPEVSSCAERVSKVCCCDKNYVVNSEGTECLQNTNSLIYHTLKKVTRDGKDYLQTEKGTNIEWWRHSKVKKSSGGLSLSAHPTAKILESATDKYNCIGYVFFKGECWIYTREVEKILNEDSNNPGNNYRSISALGWPAQEDDLAVYYKDGEVQHVGIVSSVDSNGNVLKVTSKWGSGPLMQHQPVNLGLIDKSGKTIYYYPDEYGKPVYYRRFE